jgi:hypothetical protein
MNNTNFEIDISNHHRVHHHRAQVERDKKRKREHTIKMMIDRTDRSIERARVKTNDDKSNAIEGQVDRWRWMEVLLLPILLSVTAFVDEHVRVDTANTG